MDTKHAYWALRKGKLLEAGSWMLPDRVGEDLFSRLRHRELFGEWPDLEHPRRFSEHILKLKLSDEARSPRRTLISDKEYVKEFIRERVGDGFTARTLAVLRSKQEVAGYSFPSECVIKATHSSGGIVLRRGGGPIDLPKIQRWFDWNYYFEGREPNYRNLQPKVIVEEFLSEAGQGVPRDYKIFCFQGVPALVQVDTERFIAHKRNLYSPAWKELDFAMRFPRSSRPTPRPRTLDQMLRLAREISRGFSFLRVDFFEVEGRTVIGELTNHPDGAGTVFTPDDADIRVATLFRDPHADVESLVATTDLRLYESA